MSLHDGAEAVREAIRSAEEMKIKSPKSDGSTFPVMDDAAFIGLAGEIVRTIEPHTESDPVALLMNAHTFFGNTLGRGPHYRVEGTDHAANLFVLQVGDTAKSRKGTGLDRVRQLFRVADDDWLDNRVETGLSSGEGVIWGVRDSTIKLREKDGLMIEEEIDCGITDKRLMIIESEFAGPLKVMQREGNTLSRVMRDAWDGSDLGLLTKNSPARARGAHISCVGHITAPELRKLLNETEMANGFANRYLFTSVQRSKLLPFGGHLSGDQTAALGSKIKEAIRRAKEIGLVTMTNATRAAWAAAYETLSEARPGLLGALTARADAQTVRLALIYALWDGTNEIAPSHLAAAMAVTEYCRASVEYIFGHKLGDPMADAILAALVDAGSRGLSRNEINSLFSGNRGASQIEAALGNLSRWGLAKMHKDNRTGGRPAEYWVAVREGR